MTLTNSRPPRTGPANTGSASPAVARGVAILETLAKSVGEPLGPTELARRLGFPKSTIANICLALAQSGVVLRRGSGYVLGRRLVELGAAYLDGVDQVQEFHEVCRHYQSGRFETIQLAMLVEDYEVLYVARHDGGDPLRLYSEIGHRLPATCTAVGKAILAGMDSDRLAGDLAARGGLPTRTPNSINTVPQLLEDLAITRKRGYAIDHEECTEGISCVGVALLGPNSGPDRWGISAAILRSRANPDQLAELASELSLIASGLSGSDRNLPTARHSLARTDQFR
jgi:DNA-binding IclR family transcriptional regulator